MGLALVSFGISVSAVIIATIALIRCLRHERDVNEQLDRLQAWGKAVKSLLG